MWIPSYRSQRKTEGAGASHSPAVLFLRGRGRGNSGVGLQDRGCGEVKWVCLSQNYRGCWDRLGTEEGRLQMGVTQAVSGLGFRAPVLEPVTDSQPGSSEDACWQL